MTGERADRVALGDHVGVPFESAEELLAGTVAFVAQGLESGARVVVGAATFGAEEMRARLVELVPGADRAIAAGRLAVRPFAELYLTDGAFDPEIPLAGLLRATDAAWADGHRGLWVSADMTWARPGVPGLERLTEYEARSNTLFGSGRMAAVCQYDRSLFAGPIGEAHPSAPGSARLRFLITRTPPGLQLSGEVDTTNRGAFAAVLAPLAAEPADQTIDASRLRFADVEAARLLARTAQLRAPRGTRVLCRPNVARLLDMIGADVAAGGNTSGAPDA